MCLVLYKIYSCAGKMGWTSPGCTKNTWTFSECKTRISQCDQAGQTCLSILHLAILLPCNITYFCLWRQNLLDFSSLSHSLHPLEEEQGIPLAPVYLHVVEVTMIYLSSQNASQSSDQIRGISVDSSEYLQSQIRSGRLCYMQSYADCSA